MEPDRHNLTVKFNILLNIKNLQFFHVFQMDVLEDVVVMNTDIIIKEEYNDKNKDPLSLPGFILS